MPEFRRIGVPPGTRLQALMRVDDGWLVWTAFNNASTPERWLGTYLHLKHDGSINRVTVKEDGSEDVFTIRPAD